MKLLVPNTFEPYIIKLSVSSAGSKGVKRNLILEIAKEIELSVSSAGSKGVKRVPGIVLHPEQHHFQYPRPDRRG